MACITSGMPENALAFRQIFLDYDGTGIRFDNEWGHFWHRWGMIDPKGAMKRLHEETDGTKARYASPVSRIILQGFAEADQEGAAMASRAARLRAAVAQGAEDAEACEAEDAEDQHLGRRRGGHAGSSTNVHGRFRIRLRVDSLP